MSSLAIALGILLCIIIIEILSTYYVARNKESQNTPSRICTNKNRLTMFMWEKSEYLSSRKWKDKRNKVKERDKYKCQVCGSNDHLQVHHMSGYGLIPNEPISCLITLCGKCHKEEHERVGYPKTYEDYIKFNNPIKPK